MSLGALESQSLKRKKEIWWQDILEEKDHLTRDVWYSLGNFKYHYHELAEKESNMSLENMSPNDSSGTWFKMRATIWLPWGSGVVGRGRLPGQNCYISQLHCFLHLNSHSPFLLLQSLKASIQRISKRTYRSVI